MFKRPTGHALASMAEEEARGDLADLGTPELDDSPASLVMPYRPAFIAYENHVRDCTGCSDTPVWDVSCTAGNDGAHFAHEAMTNQERLAELN